jgi:mono/diheme cytochrome c family protein
MGPDESLEAASNTAQRRVGSRLGGTAFIRTLSRHRWVVVLICATALLIACLLPSRRFRTVLKRGRATIQRVVQRVKLKRQQQVRERERREAAKLYLTAIKPVFAKNCYHCHGPDKQSGGVRLDTVGAIRLGGDNGPIVAVGKPDASLLIQVLRGADGVSAMPEDGPRLKAEEIAAVAAWIRAGSPPPEGESESAPPPVPSHWAFQPVAKPAVPVSTDPWPANPIDSFLLATHVAHSVQAVPPAAKSALLRRVYLDLIGLPPTADDLARFEADRSPDAYERVVDQLLATPQYGERWGRHLMDIWRYSEADGRKSSSLIWWSDPMVWRWRDWIVGSLNADKGYDRMILEMLAGDELPDQSVETKIATGFLVRSRFAPDRNVWLTSAIEHTGKAFLGLTINCARCHDHKFDPITQKEYYQFRRFFEAYDICPETLTLPRTGEKQQFIRAVDLRPKDKTFIFRRGQPTDPDTSVTITCGVPRILRGFLPVPKIEPVSGSTGRRLALAKWITHPRNPLTARVAVNHVWLRHFGEPLVANMYDFGVRTKAGPHQLLLDWLADDFQSHDWSLKRLHRLMVTSSAYRLSSSSRQADPSAGAPAESFAASHTKQTDPDNRLFWRMNPRRMEGELVRDSLLHLAGKLDRRIGGPPIALADADKSARRSLYFRYSREDKLAVLTTFDAASVDDCYRRTTSIVPDQALLLANDEFFWRCAREIVEHMPQATSQDFVRFAFRRILNRDPTQPEWELSAEFLIREAAPPESANGIQLVNHEVEESSGRPGTSAELSAKVRLVHALLNHNDFVTVR